MAVFDVGPVLESATLLQEKLEEAITKSKSLLEALEASQSRYTKVHGNYSILQGRLAATRGPNQSLATELIKFKFELETFVEDVFKSQEDARKDLQLWVRELEKRHEKLRHEEADLREERKKLDVQRRSIREPAADNSCSENEDNAKKSEAILKPDKSECGNVDLVSGKREDNTCSESLKSCNVEEDNTESLRVESCQSQCNCETVVQGINNQSPETYSIGCQTETNAVDMNEIGLQTDRDISAVQTSNVMSTVHDAVNSNCPALNNKVLHMSRTPKTRATASNQRVVTPVSRAGVISPVSPPGVVTPVSRIGVVTPVSRAGMVTPVSRARALLLIRQGYAARVNKAVLDEVDLLKEEVRALKLENSALSRRADEANSELFYMKNQLTVSVVDRDELWRKFEKARERINNLEGALRKRACGVVQTWKRRKQLEEEIRWTRIASVPPSRTSRRLKSNPPDGKPALPLARSFSGTRAKE